MTMDLDLPDWLTAEVDERCPSASAGTRELLAVIVGVSRLDNDGLDFREHLGRPDLPPHILKTRLPMLVAGGNAQNANDWAATQPTIGAFAWLTSIPCKNVNKHARGATLCIITEGKRRKANCIAVTGFAMDDDGVLGRAVIDKALSRPGAPIVIAYATANDGKSSDLVPVHGFKHYADRKELDCEPTDENVARFLNKKGIAYRNVRLERYEDGTPKLALDEKDVPHFVAHFDPQERTRLFIPFLNRIEGENLERLKESPSNYVAAAMACELDILGVNGCDTSTLQPVAIGYLPSGDKPNRFFKVYGSELYDPTPTIERVVAVLPKREKKALKVGGVIRPQDMGTLKGVMLASLLSEQFPELCRNKSDSPTVLHRCPFADEHNSKRGQADGSAFIYNPDPDNGTAYPTFRCHHDSCDHYRTEDFVAALIAGGEIDAESIYQNADYRIAIDESPVRLILPQRKSVSE